MAIEGGVSSVELVGHEVRINFVVSFTDGSGEGECYKQVCISEDATVADLAAQSWNDHYGLSHKFRHVIQLKFEGINPNKTVKELFWGDQALDATTLERLDCTKKLQEARNEFYNAGLEQQTRWIEQSIEHLKKKEQPGRRRYTIMLTLAILLPIVCLLSAAGFFVLAHVTNAALPALLSLGMYLMTSVAITLPGVEAATVKEDMHASADYIAYLYDCMYRLGIANERELNLTQWLERGGSVLLLCQYLRDCRTLKLQTLNLTSYLASLFRKQSHAEEFQTCLGLIREALARGLSVQIDAEGASTNEIKQIIEVFAKSKWPQPEVEQYFEVLFRLCMDNPNLLKNLTENQIGELILGQQNNENTLFTALFAQCGHFARILIDGAGASELTKELRLSLVVKIFILLNGTVLPDKSKSELQKLALQCLTAPLQKVEDELNFVRQFYLLYKADLEAKDNVSRDDEHFEVNDNASRNDEHLDARDNTSRNDEHLVANDNIARSDAEILHVWLEAWPSELREFLSRSLQSKLSKLEVTRIETTPRNFYGVAVKSDGNSHNNADADRQVVPGGQERMDHNPQEVIAGR